MQFGGNTTNTTSATQNFGLTRVPSPREIVQALDDYVIGQEHAKRVRHARMQHAACLRPLKAWPHSTHTRMHARAGFLVARKRTLPHIPLPCMMCLLARADWRATRASASVRQCVSQRAASSAHPTTALHIKRCVLPQVLAVATHNHYKRVLQRRKAARDAEAAKQAQVGRGREGGVEGWVPCDAVVLSARHAMPCRVVSCRVWSGVQGRCQHVLR